MPVQMTRTIRVTSRRNMEAADRAHFGTLLRQFRLDAGMTQQDLAERSKLSVEAISTLERGARTRPHNDTVILLARALDLSPQREALLRSAVDTSRRAQRARVSKVSLLRLVPSGTQAAPRTNLPRPLTSFVGRERELDEIATLLREHRLVTIIGAGGVGKTRIAVQVCGQVPDDFPDGTWLVDLAPLEQHALVESTLLTALQLPSTTGSALEVIIAYLKTRRLLLILDNCEHLIARAGDVAAKIAEACPSVHVLATSRQALEVAGERAYRLPSLAVPPVSFRNAQEALSHGAVALFTDRALAGRSGFSLSEDNAPDVVEICRRLDGIPLAIELAAARVNVLAPRQIAERLNERFRLLTNADSRVLPRHQTMTALIDWSYDLLTQREQRFFESLSVFAGGCTLQGAVSVCGTHGEDELDVVDLIASLAGKSLLVAELAGDAQRYRLLESSRQYAKDKLIGRGEQAAVARLHTLFFAELAERLNDSWERMPDREWLPEANIESENWRAALDWAFGKGGDLVLGQRLAAAGRVLRRSFTLIEAGRWVRMALDLVDENTPSALVASLELASSAMAARVAERTACLKAAERALKRYSELGDLAGMAQAQTIMGHSLVIFERFAEAEPLLKEALKVARELGCRRLAAEALRIIAHARSLVGDFSGARSTYTEALGLARTAGAELLAAAMVASLSGNEYDAGDLETALRLMTDALQAYRRLGLSTLPDVAACLGDIAKYLIALRRYDEARVHAHEALELAREVRHQVIVAGSLQQLAVLALLKPHIENGPAFEAHAAAAHIFGFFDTRWKTLGVPKKYGLPEYDSALELLRDAIGADVVARLMAAGASMTEDEAIAQTLALQ
jgi:predicted ATPase/DNA-binding XRE family transcriptional regulator